MGEKLKPQFKRWLAIDREIRAGNYPNCTSFAARFELGPKTIWRDIDYMKYQRNWWRSGRRKHHPRVEIGRRRMNNPGKKCYPDSNHVQIYVMILSFDIPAYPPLQKSS